MDEIVYETRLGIPRKYLSGMADFVGQLMAKAAARARRQAELDWAKTVVLKHNPALEENLPWETGSLS